MTDSAANRVAPSDRNEVEVDAILDEFGGDARAAIAALLHDLAVLANDAEITTSRGYVRGKVVRIRKPSRT